MADQEVPFTITGSTGLIGSGNIEVGEYVQQITQAGYEYYGFAVDVISGVIDGKTITSLASYGGSDNQVLMVENFSGIAGSGSDIRYDVDSHGLAFTNGTSLYNVSSTVPSQLDTTDMLLSSSSSSQTVAFRADLNTLGPKCFVEGTWILTERGLISVEQLSLDLKVSTQNGRSAVLKWLGSRTINNPDPEQCPIRIRAGAFGSDLPERDLLLSPGHPVLVGDHLVPIMCLINGTTIERHSVERVTYWHVELDQHDILLAEGLPCESYFDMGSRPWFAGSDAPLHDPEFVSADMPGRCRPVAIDGPIVEAERLRLDAVFEASLIKPCAWPSRCGASLTF